MRSLPARPCPALHARAANAAPSATGVRARGCRTFVVECAEGVAPRRCVPRKKAAVDLTPALPKPDFVDAALVGLPRNVPGIVRVPMEEHAEAAAEEFITRMPAAVGGSALAALGRERACELVATQLAATERV